MRLAPRISILALVLVTFSQAAEEVKFECDVPILWRQGKCGQDSYTVPPNGKLMFKLDDIASNFCVEVAPIGVKPDKQVSRDTKKVCESYREPTEIWTNNTNASYDIRLEVEAVDWGDIGGGKITGAVTISN